MKSVNNYEPKRDGMKLVTGQYVYTEDIAPKDCLIIKLLRSPHANAKIIEIDTSNAIKLDGIESILTYKDVPQNKVTRGGASYPEPAPYDFKILDQYVRYIGDEVAIVAGTSLSVVEKALKLIKVKYEVYEPLMDFEKAIDNKIVVHEEGFTHFDFGYDASRNIVGKYKAEVGSVDKGFSESDIILKDTYYSQPVNQVPMEPQKTFAYKDEDDRLVIVSSTQIPFHVKRIIATALGVQQEYIRVIKPRIGGGFGQKQSLVSEFYPAIVTFLTGKPSMVIYTREEVFTSSNRRHPMKFDITIGATNDGYIKAIDIVCLSDQGAYGEHAFTTLSACGDKIMSIYNKVVGARFDGNVVYTNNIVSGAYRGFGKTQGCFAVESIINQLARKIDIDPTELRLKNIIKKGEPLMLCVDHPIPMHKIIQDSCELEYCITRGRELIDWYSKYPSTKVSDTVVRGVGVGLTVQGSGVLDIDSAEATVKLMKNGKFKLLIGATDLGTGCDTILPQIMAEALSITTKEIEVYSADTDKTPYDDGAYASSTTYVTGNAVKNASYLLKDLIISKAKEIYEEDVDFIDSKIILKDRVVSTLEFMDRLEEELEVTEKNICSKETTPYKASFAEVLVDLETGKVKIEQIVGVVDCGTVINPALARVQAHGGMMQAIGHVLFEESKTSSTGREVYNNLMTYKIPSRKEDIKIHVEFADSYEPSGPFGAKSIGEIVLNATITSLSDAIGNAIGSHFNTLPITPVDILNKIKGR